MLCKFFNAMYENPSKDDWSIQVIKDLKDLNINDNLSYIKLLSEAKFKKMVKINTKEFALEDLNEKKFSHSKMEDLVFTELKIQDYLISEDISTAQKRIVFQFRTRMADYNENYGSSETPCRICSLHRDCQSHSVKCYETMKSVSVKGHYDEIFTSKISKETAKMLTEIMTSRQEKIS